MNTAQFYSMYSGINVFIELLGEHGIILNNQSKKLEAKVCAYSQGLILFRPACVPVGECYDQHTVNNFGKEYNNIISGLRSGYYFDASMADFRLIDKFGKSEIEAIIKALEL